MWRDCWIVLLSRPARALWIEISLAVYLIMLTWSRPARALWIEMDKTMRTEGRLQVEAREGLVD